MLPGSAPAQQADWTRLVKTIHGVINCVSEDTIAESAKALLRVNIFRGRGVLCKTLLRVQLGSPGLAPVLASLVAVLNTRVPSVISLLIARLVAQLRVAYGAADLSLFATARFIACLYNQQVISELLVLEFLFTCLLDPTDGSVELAVGTLSECAPFLAERFPKACDGRDSVFERLREILHDGNVSSRTQVMIDNLMALRRRNFAGQESLDPRLDLVEEHEINTHDAALDDENQPDLQEACNAFQFDADYLVNEREYDRIKKDILGAEWDKPASLLPEDNDHVMTNNEHEARERPSKPEKTKDMTDADLVDFRRTVYLVLGSGLTSEEWAHKVTHLMKDHPSRSLELCKMIIETCSQEKTFRRDFGFLGQRLCRLNKNYVSCFEETFATHYATIHRFDTRKIKNIANFYAFLLASDALPWSVLQVIRLVEAETTASSRIFLKFVFQEMNYTLSASRMAELFKSPERASALKGLFPKDSAENASFAVNFFASIELGFLTEDLRDWLKNGPKDGEGAGKGEGDGDGNDSDTSSTLSSSSSTSSSALSPGSGEENDGGDRPQNRNSGFSPANEQSSQPVDSQLSPRRRTDHAEETVREGTRSTSSRRESGSRIEAREDRESSRCYRRGSEDSEGSGSPRRTSGSRRKQRERPSSRRRRAWDYAYESDDDSYYDSRRHRERRERKRRRVDRRSDTRPSSVRSRSPPRYSYYRLSEERAGSEPRY